MPQQDTTELKQKILNTLKIKGPSLPVHIAKETGLSILFSSAFLSELASDKEVKISNMKVGSSPVYFIPKHAPLLEKFSHHLKSKEKDAFELLRQKKFLKDQDQHPAIRVALRSIKDFAIPFEQDKEIIWRYFTINPEEYKTKEKKIFITKEKPTVIITTTTTDKKPIDKPAQIQKDLNIFEKPRIKKIKPIKIPKSKKTYSSKQDKFFNKVKETLNSKNIEIIGIEGFSKSDLILKIIHQNQEKLLMAFNKRRIDEKDIIKAHSKAQEHKLSYIILSLGEPSKKFQNTIEAIKNLSGIEKIE
ncbi:MAG: hypothetical protein ABIH59_03695 [archaeon]